MATVQCKACGKTFQKPDSHVGRTQYHYCSKKCRTAPSVPCTCHECNALFFANAYAYPQAKFCSIDCRNTRNRREGIHKKGKLVICDCEYCGKEFHVRSSVAKVQKYCSQDCSGKAIGGKAMGENNGMWKEKIVVTCRYCKKQFETFPSREGRRKYCCREHRVLGNLARLATNPRTNLEIAMAEALSLHNIAHKEQVPMFNKFLVDFRLTEHPIVIQCDGMYWHDRPDNKRRDRGQDRYFAKAGYIVLRFNDDQILNSIEQCIDRVKKAVATGQLPLFPY